MYLKKKRRLTIRKPVLWGVVAVVVVAVLTAVALEKTGITNFVSKSPPMGPTLDQQKQDAEASAAKKKTLVDDNDTKANPTNSSSSNDTNTQIEVSAKQENDGTVTIFTKLYGYSDGSCNLLVTSDNKSATQSAKVMYQPEYASCAGFSVPIEPLGRGSWSIKLSVTNGDIIKDKSITYEVQ